MSTGLPCPQRQAITPESGNEGGELRGPFQPNQHEFFEQPNGTVELGAAVFQRQQFFLSRRKATLKRVCFQ